jgi:hypothetical protein
LVSGATAAESPGWFYERQSQSANISEQGGGPGGRLEACSEEFGKYCIGQEPGGRACLVANKEKLSARCKATLATLPTGPSSEGIHIPPCVRSVACASTLGGTKPTVDRVEWKQTMGYIFAYPYQLPFNMTNGGGGVSGVAMDSKGDLWAFQRNAPGQPQLFEFGPDHKLIRTVGEEVIGHQYKAHGIAVDKEDNVWICDASGSTVLKLSPEGKHLLTIGTRGHRGDWKEEMARGYCGSRWTLPLRQAATFILARAMPTRARTILVRTIQPTISAWHGSSTSTRTGNLSTSGLAKIGARENSRQSTGSGSIRPTAMSGSATAISIASSSTLKWASS